MDKAQISEFKKQWFFSAEFQKKWKIYLETFGEDLNDIWSDDYDKKLRLAETRPPKRPNSSSAGDRQACRSGFL